jgi:hypothetical protein
MAAKCIECGEHVYSPPCYPDELQSAGECAEDCGYILCEDCSMRLGGICSRCQDEMSEP